MGKAKVKGLGLGFNIPLLGLLFKWIGKERYWKKGMGKVKGDITEKMILTYVKIRGAHW